MPGYAVLVDDDGGGAERPIIAVRREELAAHRALSPTVDRWIETVGFTAEAGSHCLVPTTQGDLAHVLLGLGDGDSAPLGAIWDWAALPARLPPGTYRIAPEPAEAEANAAALGWALAAYRYDRYRTRPGGFARLRWPRACDRPAVTQAAEATHLVRDLINAPAADMGPAELAAAAQGVAARFAAKVSVIEGEDLLDCGWPAVHAVGRASTRPPRLIDLTWGEPSAPRVTLCGKGVCFDSGGLDIKPAAAMKLMKKDMGGAAIALGLAQMVMAAGLPVRLRVLIPAVENSIAGNAMRPLDVVPTRKGLTIEIGNTDAEGRVILADALAEAAREQPAMLVDLATLTGAARVALGTELPALFCNDEALAADILAAAERESDPVWRLPLWKAYRRHIDGKVADLNNAPDLPFAGAITAALFLAEFVDPPCPWAHLDLMAWNTESRPGRPEGGEAMAMRALFRTIAHRYPASPPRT